MRTTLRAWSASLVTLLAAAAGLFAVSATSTSTSTIRMALAAAVLGVLASTAGLLVTPAAERTLGRRLLWGGTVPLACGAGTASLVAASAALAVAVLAGLPWLLGPLLAGVLGARLPEVSLPRFAVPLRRRSDSRR